MLRRNSSGLSSNQEARRKLLKLGTCGAMTNTTLLSSMVNMRLTSSLLAGGPYTDYKALVMIFFNGAIDGFQVLSPFDDTEYGFYATSRSGMSLRRQDPNGAPGVALSGGSANPVEYGLTHRVVDTPTGKAYGIHPRFTNLRDMYNAREATFVCNVGSLIDPLFVPGNPTQTRNNYTGSALKKPIGLFSHPDLVRHWQTAFPTSRNTVKGWGGKMADILTDKASNDPNRFYSAVSLIGSNIWQTGSAVLPYAVSSQTATSIGGSIPLAGYAPFSTDSGSEYVSLNDIDEIYADMQNDLVNQTYVDLLEKTMVASRADARVAADALQNAINTTLNPGNALPPGITFDNTGLGAQLATVARMIQARSSLGFATGRQIFMVSVGGWDHHTSLLDNQDAMIGGNYTQTTPGIGGGGPGGIDSGLKQFRDYLVAAGLFNDVTSFTISDFGRTISSNGAGTDHAWGNNMIVMGGDLNISAGSPRIFGSYPQIRLGTNQNQGLDTSTRGTYIPTLATDSYQAELAMWLGLAPGDVRGDANGASGVFPFAFKHFGSNTTRPVGFMKS